MAVTPTAPRQKSSPSRPTLLIIALFTYTSFLASDLLLVGEHPEEQWFMLPDVAAQVKERPGVSAPRQLLLLVSRMCITFCGYSVICAIIRSARGSRWAAHAFTSYGTTRQA